jgi:hypothetical protein
VKLVFVKNEGWFGRLIRWATRSRWDHVCIWDPVTLECWEALGTKGVVHHFQWWPSPSMQSCSVVAPNEHELRLRLREFLNEQVGKGYDWFSLARFISRRVRSFGEARSRWFCSELAAAAFEEAGVKLLRRAPEHISPALLHASPLLIAEPVMRPVHE